MGTKSLFSDHKSALKLAVAKVAELCEYTESHWTVYFLNSLHLMFLLNYNGHTLLVLGVYFA